MKFPTVPKGSSSGPIDNQFTLFLFLFGILASLFALVGNFGALSFLPFGMMIGGYVIKRTFQIKSRDIPTIGFTVNNLTYIAGSLILVLTINFLLGYLHFSFLQPPIPAAAIAASAQYAYVPVYVFTSLFAIAEEYLFRSVLMYLIFGRLNNNQFMAIGGSSFLWVIFHIFVYGTQPFVLGFVLFTGLIFGFVTLYNQNTLIASTVHIINNLMAASLAIMSVIG